MSSDDDMVSISGSAVSGNSHRPIREVGDAPLGDSLPCVRGEEEDACRGEA
jgi:hypothetical protein